jgi:tetratricopeptide (TPR) repeat protein
MKTVDELAAMGQKLLDQGRLDQAAAAFGEALEADHRSVPASLGLARISRAVSLVERARVILDRTFGFAPQDARALVLRGHVELCRGQLADAIDVFTRAASGAPAS